MSTIELDTEKIDGLVRSIILTDFPFDNTYKLYTNNYEVLTAKYDGQNMRFDMFDPCRSNILDCFISAAVGTNDQNIENRNEYLNFNRIASVSIKCENQLSGSYTIKLDGLFHFYRDGQWTPDIIEYSVNL